MAQISVDVGTPTDDLSQAEGGPVLQIQRAVIEIQALGIAGEVMKDECRRA